MEKRPESATQDCVPLVRGHLSSCQRFHKSRCYTGLGVGDERLIITLYRPRQTWGPRADSLCFEQPSPLRKQDVFNIV